MANASTIAARCTHVLSTGLWLLFVGRMLLTLNPTYDFYLPIGERVGSVFLFSIWLLMPLVFAISIVYMFAIIKELDVSVLGMLVAMFRDPRSVPPLIGSVVVVAYQLWLINFVYQNWTINFSFLVGLVQLFPAISLVLHSLCQLCMIAMSSMFERGSRNLIHLAELQISINVGMLIHLFCTVIVVCSQEPWKLSDIAVLVVTELVFRIIGLFAFARMRSGQPRLCPAVRVSTTQDIPCLVFVRQQEKNSHKKVPYETLPRPDSATVAQDTTVLATAVDDTLLLCIQPVTRMPTSLLASDEVYTFHTLSLQNIQYDVARCKEPSYLTVCCQASADGTPDDLVLICKELSYQTISRLAWKPYVLVHGRESTNDLVENKASISTCLDSCDRVNC